MRRVTLISLMLVLIAACGTPDQPTSAPSPISQSAQTNAYPTPFVATAVPTSVPPTATTVPTVVASATATPESQILPLELTLDQPTWATWHLETTTIITTSSYDLRIWGWSNDGTQLLYSQDQTLRVMTIADQTIITIPIVAKRAVWSPQDSHTIAYSTQDMTRPNTPIQKVIIADLKSQSSVEVGEFPLPHDTPMELRWNADQGLIVATAQRMLAFVPQQRSVARTIYQSTNSTMPPNLAPNGQRGLQTIPYITNDNKRDGYLVHLINEGKVTTTLTKTDEYPRIVWSQDSTFVAFTDARDSIFIADAQGTLRYKTTIGHRNQSPIAWSPDRQYLVYDFNNAGQSPFNAYIAKIGERGSIRLNIQDMSRHGGGVTSVAWSPANNYIAYTLERHDSTSSKTQDALTILKIIR